MCGHMSTCEGTYVCKYAGRGLFICVWLFIDYRYVYKYVYLCVCGYVKLVCSHIHFMQELLISPLSINGDGLIKWGL